MLFRSVQVSIRRPGELTDREFTLTRRVLDIEYIHTTLLDADTGYIGIDAFRENESDLKLYADFLALCGQTGRKNLIIDLRGNGGGSVPMAREMLCYLPGLENELLFSLVDANEAEEYRYEKKGTWVPKSIIVLVDGGSASASEIFSGSLQDRKRALLVGENTYGKARAQFHFELPFDEHPDFLVVTAYTVELPVSGEYQAEGLQPDYVVELEIVEGMDLSEVPRMATMQAMLPAFVESARIKQLEQQLHFLGWFRAEPDDVFDAYTMHAVQSFQLSMGLPAMSYVSSETLYVLDALLNLYEIVEYIPVDNQLEFALDLVK